MAPEHSSRRASTRSGARRALAARTRRLAAGATAAILLGAMTGCGGADERPNILLYVSDTLRADGLGCYGNDAVRTPNFDAFAREGTLFERALAPSSWTRASMGAILTGTPPAVHGAEGRYHVLEDSVVLISEILTGEGYATANITTNRNVGSYFGFDQGWSEGGFIELYPAKEDRMVHVNELTTRADEVTRRAIQWIETAEQPFCLVVHTIDPHSPYTPPKKWDRYGRGIKSRVDGSQQSLQAIHKDRTPDDERKVRSLYDGEIAFNDDAFGELVAYLRKRELYDRTIAVMTSDHGEEFWELYERGHGKNVHEKTLHVPLLIRYPGVVDAGARVSRLVTITDILPTVFDLAGLAIPYWVRGRSVLAAPDEPGEVFFSSCLLGERELYAVRTSEWKLVYDAQKGTRRLYDMTSAEIEGENVARANPGVVKELYQKLQDELQRTRDTRVELHGSVRAPEVGLTDELREDLEGLGYVEGDEESGPDSADDEPR